MYAKVIITILCLFSFFPAALTAMAGCLSGQCHQDLAATKYVHGPVAAELAGGMGCVACHVPAGKECSPGSGGTFKPLPAAREMCRICHSSGTGSQHTEKEIDCLKCHDPHGSNSGPELKR